MSHPKPRILAIDDTPANLLTLGVALEKEFDLQIATSGMMGLELAINSPPDMILLDVMMPDMDGFETCKHLKAEERLNRVPIVFVTALDEEDSELKGLALGGADYLTKPINVQVARQRIRNIVEREWLRKEVEAQRDLLDAQITELKCAQINLQESEEQFRTLFEQNASVMLLIDPTSGAIINANKAASIYYGYSKECLIGMLTSSINPLPPERLKEERQRALHGACNYFLFSHRLASGEMRDVEVYSTPIKRDGCYLLFSIVHDITERKQAEDKLRLAANVFTHSHEGIMITKPDGTIIDVNEAFTRITGYSRNDILGQNPRLLSSGRQGNEFYSGMWGSLLEKGHWQSEVWNRRKNGEVYAEMQTISTVLDEQGKPQHYVSLFSDITANKEYQHQLEHIAHYDALTTLPNRVLLSDRLHQAMAQAERHGQQLALAYLDLDGFKSINDHHGHEAGDQLLITLASRMKQALREGDTLARLGGDEFVAVLVDLPDVAASALVLTRLLAAAAQPVHIGDLALQVSASIGVTFYPQIDDVDADQLLRQADQSMYQAKLTGKNRYHVFDAEQDRSVRGHHEDLESIRRALSAREFILYYQPKVNMRTGAVVGVEALIRWQHPEHGLLLPAVFLPVIEDHPLSVEMGHWVIDTALNQIGIWHDCGLDLPVSINVSANQLQQSDFVEHLQQCLMAHPRVRPGDLMLEVLETNALEDLAQVSGIMEACRKIGVGFALDDFGTGYSSLTYLKRLPVIELKIDQSFVHDMLDNPDDLAILEGVIGLSTAFRRQVVAEGVETVAHGELLLQLGCELAQGYGIARPMPATDIPAWIKAWQPDLAWVGQRRVSRDDLPLIFASVEHRAWVAAIEASIKGGFEASVPLDHTQCYFGQWLDGNGRAHYGNHPSFDTIELLHRQVHAIAAELCELCAKEQSAEALVRLSEIHRLQDTLLERIQALIQELQQ